MADKPFFADKFPTNKNELMEYLGRLIPADVVIRTIKTEHPYQYHGFNHPRGSLGPSGEVTLTIDMTVKAPKPKSSAELAREIADAALMLGRGNIPFELVEEYNDAKVREDVNSPCKCAGIIPGRTYVGDRFYCQKCGREAKGGA